MNIMDVLNHGLLRVRGYVMLSGKKIVSTKSFYRTDTAEIKHKAYTNKLKSVLRNGEKNYHIKLEQEKTM